MPITDRYGFHIEFPELPRNLQFKTVEDYENYIARLRGFDAYAAGHIELMREGIRRGVTVPSVIMQRYHEPIEAQIVDDPEKSLLYAPLQKFPEKIRDADRERLRTAAKAAIAESVVPGYRQFLTFMTGRVCAELPRHDCRVGPAQGPRLLPPLRAEVHDGRRPHAGGDSRHRQSEKSSGFAARWTRSSARSASRAASTEFTEQLRSDEKFYAKSPAELVEEVSAILKRIDGQLPAMFGKLPRMPYGVREVPDVHRPAGDVRLLPAADRRRHAGRVLLHQHVQSAGPAAVHARIAVAARSGARAIICRSRCSRNSEACPSFASSAASRCSSKAGRSMPSGSGRRWASTRIPTAISAG